MGNYRLYCSECKAAFDDVFLNICPSCGNAGPLVRTDYQVSKFKPLNLPGFWKFLPWLPCIEWNDKIRSQTIVYKSNGLSKELGLNNLYIAFNGYWPEKDANMVTCTFKELEAPPTFQRASERCIDNLVIASAGNTARAFIFAAQYFDIDLYVVVPKNSIYKLVLPFQVPDNVFIIAVNQDSDYSDAITFSGRMANALNLVPEGGARNIARRDGMGTVMLECVHELKRLPEHYFQAVGSGTGAIAALEASQRLLSSGQYLDALPRLHLSQNQPFTPLTDAWNNGSSELIKIPEDKQRKAISEVFAQVLTNRYPPYSVGGGVYDILNTSEGSMYGITNADARSAGKLFESSEGIDIVPAASVAVGSLIQALESEKVKADDTILINITGGGENRLWEDHDKNKIEPDILCDSTIEMDDLKHALEACHDQRNVR